MCPCHKDSGILGSSGKSIASRLRRWPFPSTQHWWGSSRMLDPVLASPIQKRYGLTGMRPLKGCEGDLHHGVSLIWGKAERVGTFRSGKERSWEEFIHMYLMEGRKEDTGTGYPDRLWSLNPWRYLSPDLTWPWATSSGWLCFEPGAKLDNIWSCMPISTTVWFSEVIQRRVELKCNFCECCLLVPSKTSLISVANYLFKRSHGWFYICPSC